MQRYIVRRLLQAIPTFFGITIIVYLIMLLAPGDPVSLLTFDPTIRQDERERLAIKLGVNDPFHIQYLRWLIGDDWMMVDSNADGEVDSWGDNYGILRGDFGTSFKFRGSNPLKLISERLGATIELNIAVVLIGVIGRAFGRRTGSGTARPPLRQVVSDIRSSRGFCAGFLVCPVGNHADGPGFAARVGTIRHRQWQSIPAHGWSLSTGTRGLPAHLRASALHDLAGTSQFFGTDRGLVTLYARVDARNHQ